MIETLVRVGVKTILDMWTIDMSELRALRATDLTQNDIIRVSTMINQAADKLISTINNGKNISAYKIMELHCHASAMRTC